MIIGFNLREEANMSHIDTENRNGKISGLTCYREQRTISAENDKAVTIFPFSAQKRKEKILIHDIIFICGSENFGTFRF